MTPAAPYHLARSRAGCDRPGEPPVQTLSEIRQLLAERGLRPKHRLGQNFLHDHNQLRRLLDAARVTSGDLVLEVGPGTGTLTEALLQRGADVIACELDPDMAGIVRDRIEQVVPGCGRFTLIVGDALGKHRRLNAPLAEAIGERPFKLVANLPYQIASPLIGTLLIEHPRAMGQFVTIQREVADRLTAVPSTKAYGSLGVIVQALAKVERLAVLSPSCFWPEPEVTSAMAAIVPRPDALARFGGLQREFARFVTGLFTKRRKQLGSIIGRGHPAWPQLSVHGISPDLRPEQLAIEQMVALWQATGQR